MSTDAAAIIRSTFPLNAQKYGLTGAGAAGIQSDLETGFISEYSGSNPAQCAQARFNPADYTQSGNLGIAGIFAKGSGTMGAKISSSIALGLKAIPVVGQFLSDIWVSISPFAHHGAAVAKEQSTLCTLIPQVNQQLAQLDTDVASGNLSAADADAQLETMVRSFDESTASITKSSGSSCNAGCVMQAVVRSEATLREEKYRNAPMYYVKKYWWIGATALAVYLLLRK